MKKFLRVLIGIVAFFLTLFIALYVWTIGDYKLEKTVAEDASIPHITINGYDYHAEAFGADSSQVVIVLHGGPGNDYKSLLSLKALADQYKVVFYDQRGAGLSPRVPSEQLTLQSSIADLHDIVMYFSPDKKVNLIGHSWGGMLACAYIQAHADKVDKVVLAEPGMLTTEAAEEFAKYMKVDFSWPLLGLVTKIVFQSLHLDNPGEQGRIDYIYQNIAFNTSVKGNPLEAYFCNGEMSDIARDYWRIGTMANMNIINSGRNEEGEMKLDLVSGLEDFDQKILMLTGECNTLIGSPYQQKYHMPHFKSAQLVELAGTGHHMIGEKPEETVSLIRGYFSE